MRVRVYLLLAVALAALACVAVQAAQPDAAVAAADEEPSLSLGDSLMVSAQNQRMHRIRRKQEETSSLTPLCTVSL